MKQINTLETFEKTHLDFCLQLYWGSPGRSWLGSRPVPHPRGRGSSKRPVDVPVDIHHSSAAHGGLLGAGRSVFCKLSLLLPARNKCYHFQNFWHHSGTCSKITENSKQSALASCDIAEGEITRLSLEPQGPWTAPATTLFTTATITPGSGRHQRVPAGTQEIYRATHTSSSCVGLFSTPVYKWTPWSHSDVHLSAKVSDS